MNTYAIRRNQAWQSPEDVQAVAERSKAVTDSEFPAGIRWIRSYVLAREDGSLGSICIYRASSPEAIRRHAHRVGMPGTFVALGVTRASGDSVRAPLPK